MFKPNNIPQLSPYFTVRDGAKSIEFYKTAFGFVLEEAVKDEEGNPQHVAMRKQDAYIMFSPEGVYGSTKKAPINLGVQMPVNMYVYCKNVDALYDQAMAHGAKSVQVPQDTFWGDRFCCVSDRDGYEWCFATILKK